MTATFPRNDRQAALNLLYNKPIHSVGNTLISLIEEKGYSSIIDVGCGHFPYLKQIRESNVNCERITLLDHDPSLIERFKPSTDAALRNLAAKTQLLKLIGPEYDFTQFIESDDERLQNELMPDQLQGYDIVVLSATLHELNIQDAIRCTKSANRNMVTPFLQRLMRTLRSMLNPGGTLLLAEFYYPSYLTGSEKNFMAKVQQEMLGHADPPKAFFAPSEVVLEGKTEALNLLELRETEPLKDADDETIISLLTINRLINQQKKLLDPELADKVSSLDSDRAIGSWYSERYPEECKSTRDIVAARLREFNFLGSDAIPPFSHAGHLLRQRGHFVATFTPRLEEYKNYKDTNIYRDLHNPRRELMALISQRELSIAEFLSKKQVRTKLEKIARKLGVRTPDSKIEVRRLYQCILGDEDGLFYRLAKHTAEISTRWSSSNGFQSPQYLAIWLSHNSRLLTEKSNESARFNPVYGNPVDEAETRQYRCYHVLPSDTSSDEIRERDWSTIAFNCLLVPDGLDAGDGRLIKGPSIHEWLRRLSKTPQTWRRSVTIWHAPLSTNGNNQPNIDLPATEAAGSTLQLIRRNLRTKTRLAGSESVPVHVEFRLPLDSPSDTYRCGRELNTFLSGTISFSEAESEQPEDSSERVLFCSTPAIWALEKQDSLICEKMQEGLASLFYDFVFLSRFVSFEAALTNKRKSLLNALVDFEDRWLNSARVRYCSWEHDGSLTIKPGVCAPNDVHNKTPSISDNLVDERLVFLPLKMTEQIKEATKQARRLLKDPYYKPMDPSLLPTAMITITLADAGVEAEAPSLIYFSDTLLDHDWIELTAQLAEKPFAYLSKVEQTIIAEQSAIKAAKREQLQAILSNIGHDGKHQAETIKRIIDTRWKGSQEIACKFSASLGGRMSGYSRFALVSQKQLSYVIEDLENDVEDIANAISVEDVFYSEIQSIVARIIANRKDSTEAKALFESLFSEPSHKAFIQALQKKGVRFNYQGESFFLPETVEQSDPLLIACLRIIFSEIIRNAIRHDWKSMIIGSSSDINREVTLKVSMENKTNSRSSSGSEFLRFEIEHSTSKEPRLDEKDGCVGLLSIMAALRACAGVANTVKELSSGSDHEVLFPNYENGLARTSFSIPYIGFKCNDC